MSSAISRFFRILFTRYAESFEYKDRWRLQRTLEVRTWSKRSAATGHERPRVGLGSLALLSMVLFSWTNKRADHNADGTRNRIELTTMGKAREGERNTLRCDSRLWEYFSYCSRKRRAYTSSTLMGNCPPQLGRIGCHCALARDSSGSVSIRKAGVSQILARS